MQGQLGYREVYALTLEQLAKHPKGQHAALVDAILKDGRKRGIIPHERGNSIVHRSSRTFEEEQIAEQVREAMWECLSKRLIIFGRDGANPEWPFYRVTEHGLRALESSVPQPYDPDGFIAYFDRVCPESDPVVRSYLAEAVLAFNSDCQRSAAVMLGCASEQLVLLLCEALDAALEGSDAGTRFRKKLSERDMISHKYTTLRKQLDVMAAEKKLPREHAEAVASIIPAGFEMVRRCRNAAGHPDAIGDVSSDTIFMNLRTFTEYARCTMALIDHFRIAQAAE